MLYQLADCVAAKSCDPCLKAVYGGVGEGMILTWEDQIS